MISDYFHDSWDQMKKDYKDLSINSYDKGPGANLDVTQQPAALAMNPEHARDKSVCRIIIHNTELISKKGLMALCEPFGTVVYIHKPQHLTKLAFVEFSNQSEAGLAIEHLNNKLGFRFDAALARDKPSVQSKMPSRSLMEPRIEAEAPSKRRIKGPFSQPVSITYPGTHYFTLEDYEDENLRRIDEDLVFCNPKTVPYPRGGYKSDPKRSDRLIQAMKKAPSEVVGPWKKNIYIYNGQDEDVGACFVHGRCVFCKSRSAYTCGKCTASYCSVKCQKDDWPTHTESCGQNMDEQTMTPKAILGVKEVLTTNEFPPNLSCVTIVSALSPRQLFIRSLEEKYDRAYLTTIDDIAKYAVNAKQITKMPQVGDILLANYESNGYYRALIIKLIGNDAVIVYIDLGFVAKIKITELRELNSDELKYRQLNLFKVFLKDVTPDNGNVDKAMEYLNNLINLPLVLAYGDQQNVVTLKKETNGDLINRRINEIIEITLCPLTEKYIDYQQDIPKKQLDANESTEIMILDRSTIGVEGFISFIEYADLPFLEELEIKIQNYCSKVREYVDYTPRVHEICLVKVDTKWYRGVCLETVGDRRPTLFLCDYGNFLIAPLEHIRKIPADLATEVRTTSGMIDGFKEKIDAGYKLTKEMLDEHLPLNKKMVAEVFYKKIEDTETGEDMMRMLRIKDFMNCELSEM